MVTDRVRIYELARDLGVSNKELMDAIKANLRVSVKSHSSTIRVVDANRLRDIIKSSKANKNQEAEKVTKTVEAKTNTMNKEKQLEINKVLKPQTEADAEKESPKTADKSAEEAQGQKETSAKGPKEEKKPLRSDRYLKPSQQPQQKSSQKPSQGSLSGIHSDQLYNISGNKYKRKPGASGGSADQRSQKPVNTRRMKPRSSAFSSKTEEPAVNKVQEVSTTVEKQEKPTTPANVQPKEALTSQKPVEKKTETPQESKVTEKEMPVAKPEQKEAKPSQPKEGEKRPSGDFEKRRPPDKRPPVKGARAEKPDRERTERGAKPAPKPDNSPTGKPDRSWKKKKEKKDKFEEVKSLTEIFNKKKKGEKKPEVPVEELKPTEIYIPGTLTVAELAHMLKINVTEVIKELMKSGVLATLNESVSKEAAIEVSEKLGYTIISEEKAKEEQELKKIEEDIKVEEAKSKEVVDKSKLVERAPIVTIMGHVDHGKTTLLDAIRAAKNKLVDAEVGGITQSIGAYSVEANGKPIVFIDTPGHKAFTAMRARGAQVTDIVILIVAADDGIMPQTVEAINHAKAANVPIIVAVNKIDKAGAEPDRVLQQLTEHGLLPEDWGGETIVVPLSALKGDGIEDLLGYINLVAEVQELNANPEKPAHGVVIESELDKGKGAVARVIVQDGTLQVGDSIIVGTVGGRVRALINDVGQRVEKAGPSTPVEILGLNEVPQAGDAFEKISDDKVLKQMVADRKEEEREKRFANTSGTLQRDTIFKARQRMKEEGGVKDLNIIIKADTDGSVRAVEASLKALKSEEVTLKIIHTAVGDISEADIMLAATSSAIVLGFGVKEDVNAQKISVTENVSVQTYEIIYHMIEDVEKLMLGLLEPEYEEVELGKAEVRDLFTIGKNTVIAGCYVIEGKILRNKTAYVLRNGKEIFKGNLDNLKRFKDDAKEVAQGFECGISFNKFNDLEVGDIIRVTMLEEKERNKLK